MRLKGVLGAKPVKPAHQSAGSAVKAEVLISIVAIRSLVGTGTIGILGRSAFVTSSWLLRELHVEIRRSHAARESNVRTTRANLLGLPPMPMAEAYTTSCD